MISKIGPGNSKESAEYIGLASNRFKERYYNHISVFRVKKQQLSTSLSKHIWEKMLHLR